MRRTRPLAQAKALALPRSRRDASPPPVPTVRPDAESPPPQPPAAPEDEAIEAAIIRMVEAAYT